MSDENDGSLDYLIRLKADTRGAEEAHKGFVHAGTGAREFHALLHRVTEESPILGMALRTAISPIGGTFMAAVFALNALKKAEEESIHAAEEAAQKNAEPMANMGKGADECADAIYKLITAYKEWEKHGNDVTAELARASQALAVNVEKIKDEAAQITAAAEARKKAALVILETDRASGRISQAGYDVAKSRIEGRATEESEAAAKKALEGELKARIEAANKVEAQMVAAREAAAKAEKAAEQGAGKEKRIAQLESEAQIAQGKADAAKKERPVAQERATEAAAAAEMPSIGKEVTAIPLIGPVLNALGVQSAGDASAAARKAATKVDEADKEIKEQTHLAQSAGDTAARLKAQREQEEKDAKKAQENADKLREAYERQANEIEKLQEKLAALTGTVAATKSYKDFSSAMETPFGKAAFGDVTAAEDTAKALAKHKEVSDESKRQLIEIVSAVAGHKVSLEQAVIMMKGAADSMDIFVKDVVRLADGMASIGNMVKALHAKLPFLETQVAALAANPGTRTLPGEN